jgi:CHAT domain
VRDPSDTFYPPPSGEFLTDPQRKALADILRMLDELDYLHSRIEPFDSEMVERLRSVCQTEEELLRMATEIDQWTHWYRLPSYWLAYLFSRVTRRQRSYFYFMACAVLADAKLHGYEDLAVADIEDAYYELLMNRELLGSLAEELAGPLKAKLEIFYRFYASWCKPFDYDQCNPAGDHLYAVMTWAELYRVFPLLPAYGPDEPEPLLQIINECQDRSRAYHRVLARRFLGNLHGEARRLEEALEQYRLGSEEAQAVGLDAEIGHLRRLYGHALAGAGRLEEAAKELEDAYRHDDHPIFDYWRAIDARELGEVWARQAVAAGSVQHPNPELLQRALEAYRSGRMIFEQHLSTVAVLPVARAIKLQMFRSFADNAIAVAMALDSIKDVVAEVELNAPREFLDAAIEIEAARRQGPDSVKEFRAAWEVFHRHLTTVPARFDDYLASVPDEHEARESYLQARAAVSESVAVDLSDEAAQAALEMHLPGVLFLLFFVGAHRTAVILVDGEGRGAAAQWIEVSERDLRALNHAYATALSEATWLPDQAVATLPALDRLIEGYSTFLGPFLETLAPQLEGRHLKIFPRMQLNAVPMHALLIAGRRLMDYCDVSYGQSLGHFVRVQAAADAADGQMTGPQHLTMVLDSRRAPAFGGVTGSLGTIYGDRFSVLDQPTWEEFQIQMSEQPASDVFFACHGAYYPAEPASSSLLFGAPEGVSFSRLFADVDFPRCRSVIMGACESGLGRAEISSEYIGLPTVFLSAGVRYVIGSLWKVNQLATAVLFDRYFELLAHAKPSVPAALNQAQRDTMALTRDQLADWVTQRMPALSRNLLHEVERMNAYPFSHPFYWGGFYVSGDI